MRAVDSQPLIIYPNVKKMVGLTIAALIFVVLGIIFVAVALTEQESAGALMAIGIISILFFGACLLYFMYRLINKKPSLVIDEEGLTDNSSYIGGGRLLWTDIKEIKLYMFMGQQFIGIELNDNQSYLDRQSGLKKMLMGLNRSMVKAPVNIAQNSFAIPLDQLCSYMVSMWEKAVQHQTE
ncbi:STM3941 family protein [Paenibacillus sp. GCM10027626]|uniref:STM3941 family protein n=1 Tax=Paenibacillus sp. GCM10027626 TaxID=3273411 RepID=UPI00363087AE